MTEQQQKKIPKQHSALNLTVWMVGEEAQTSQDLLAAQGNEYASALMSIALGSNARTTESVAEKKKKKKEAFNKKTLLRRASRC